MKPTEEHENSTNDTERVENDRKVKKYKQYSDDSVRSALNLIQSEGMTPTNAFKLCKIPKSTGYRLLREFNISDGIMIPCKNKSPPVQTVQLTTEQKDVLISHFDQHPSSTIGDARKLLLDTFPDIHITFSELYMHLIHICSFSLKSNKKQSECTEETDYQTIHAWREAGVDFTKNCIFIDQAGFNVHLARVGTSTNKGVHTTTKLHTVKGASFSLMGSISPFGVIGMSKVEPLIATDAKKLNEEFLQGETGEQAWKKGITTFHLAKFIEIVLDTLDQHEMKGYYVVLNNQADYHHIYIRELVEKRGHQLLLLPVHATAFNPMELCWSKVRQHIRRDPMKEHDGLVERIKEAAAQLTLGDCIGWIQQSAANWDQFLNKSVA